MKYIDKSVEENTNFYEFLPAQKLAYSQKPVVNVRKCLECRNCVISEETSNRVTLLPSSIEKSLREISPQLEKQSIFRQDDIDYFQVSKVSTADNNRSAVFKFIFPYDSKLNQVFEFIENNYHQPISLREVAQAVGYSPTYLTHLVRRQTGQSVYAWIIKRRMIEACSLLRETNQAVNQVAKAVGYQDAGYFSRHFRKIYGVSPRDWKKMYQI